MPEYTAEFTSNVSNFNSEVDAGLSRFEARLQKTGQSMSDTDFGRNFGQGLLTSFDRIAADVEGRAKALAEQLRTQLQAGAKGAEVGAPLGGGTVASNTTDLARQGVQQLEASLKSALTSLPPELDSLRPQLVSIVREMAQSLITSLRSTEQAVAAELRQGLGSNAASIIGRSNVTQVGNRLAANVGGAEQARSAAADQAASNAGKQGSEAASQDVFVQLRQLTEQLGQFIIAARKTVDPNSVSQPNQTKAIPSLIDQLQANPDSLSSALISKMIQQARGLATIAEGDVKRYGISGEEAAATKEQVAELRAAANELVRFRDELRLVEASLRGVGGAGAGGVGGVTPVSGRGPLRAGPTKQELIDEANNPNLPGTHFGAPGVTSYSPSAPIFRQENGQMVAYKGIPNIPNEKVGAQPADVLNAEAQASAERAYAVAQEKLARDRQADAQKAGKLETAAANEDIKRVENKQALAQKAGRLETSAANEDIKRTEAQLAAARKLDLGARRLSGELIPIGGAINPQYHRDQQGNLINRAGEITVDPNDLANARAEEVRTTARQAAANARAQQQAQSQQRGQQNPSPGQAFLGGLTSRGFEAPGTGLTSLFGTTGVLARYAVAGAGISALYQGLSQLKQGIIGVNSAELELNIALGTTGAKSLDQTLAFTDMANAGVNATDALAVGTQAVIIFQSEIKNSADATQVFNNVITQSAQLAIVAGINIKQASQELNAATQGFQFGSAGMARISDAIVNAHKNTGATTADLSQIAASTAAQANLAGVSPEALLNLSGEVGRKSSLSPAELSSGFNRLVAKSGTGSLNQLLTATNAGAPSGDFIKDIERAAAGFQTLTKSQQQAALSAYAGGRGLQFITGVFASANKLAGDNAKSNDGLGATYAESQKKLHSFAGELKTFGATLSNLFQNIGGSRLFDFLGPALEVLRGMLAVVNQLLVAFRLIPGPIREILGALIAARVVVASIAAIRNTDTLRYIPGIHGRGTPPLPGSTVVPVAGAGVIGAEAVGGRAAANSILATEGGALGAAAAGEVAALKAGAASILAAHEQEAVGILAQAQAEANAKIAETGREIRLLAGATDAEIAERRAAGAAAADAILATGQELAGVIRLTGAEIAAATTTASEEIVAGGAAGGIGGAGAGLLGRVRGGFLGRDVGLGVRNAGASLGARAFGAAAADLAPLALPVVAGVLSYFAVTNARNKIVGAENAGFNTLSATPGNFSPDDLKASASALLDASHNIGKSSSGFLGTITGGLVELFGGVNRGQERAQLEAEARVRIAEANHLQAVTNDPLSGALNSGAKLDFASTQTLTTSLQSLVDQGRSATDVINALTARVKQFNEVAALDGGRLRAGDATKFAADLGTAISQSLVTAAQSVNTGGITESTAAGTLADKTAANKVLGLNQSRLAGSLQSDIMGTLRQEGLGSGGVVNQASLFKAAQTSLSKSLGLTIEQYAALEPNLRAALDLVVKGAIATVSGRFNWGPRTLLAGQSQQLAAGTGERIRIGLQTEAGYIKDANGNVGDTSGDLGPFRAGQNRQAASKILGMSEDQKKRFSSGVESDINKELTREGADKGKPVDTKKLFAAAVTSVRERLGYTLKQWIALPSYVREAFESEAKGDIALTLRDVAGGRGGMSPQQVAEYLKAVVQYAPAAGQEAAAWAKVDPKNKDPNNQTGGDPLGQGAGVVGAQTTLKYLKEARTVAQNALIKPGQTIDQMKNEQQYLDSLNAEIAVATGQLMDATVAGMQVVGDLAISAIPPGDKIGRIKSQIGLLKQQQSQYGPGTDEYKAYQTKINDQNNGLVDQALANTTSQNLVGVDPRNTLEKLKKASENAQTVYRNAQTRGFTGADLTGPQQAATDATIAYFQGIVTDANTRRDTAVAIGDVRGVANAAVVDAFNTAAADEQGGTQQGADYRIAYQKYYDALMTSAQFVGTMATSKADPRDAYNVAQAQMTAASAILAVASKNDPAYWQAYAQYLSGTIALSKAIVQDTSIARQLHEDTTNPIVKAHDAVLDAQRQLAEDRAHPATDPAAQQRIINTDQLALNDARNAEVKSTFDTRLKGIQDEYDLNRMSGAAYIQSLRNLRAGIVGNSYQAQQMRIEIDKALKAAYGNLQGQFNLGDIKVPSVYEVRRSVSAAAAGHQFSDTSNVSITINGIGSTAEVVQIVKQQLGAASVNRRAPTVTRRV